MKKPLQTSGAIDAPLLGLLVVLLVGGVFIFASASLGLLARSGSPVASIIFNHLVFGVGAGVCILIVTSRLPYEIWRKYAYILFGLSVVATALVFMPHVGLAAGGAHRWIHIGSFSLQPSEFLKIGVLLALAAYFTQFRSRLSDIRFGLGGFVCIVGIPSVLLLLQPDNGTLGIIICAAGAMYLAAGASVRDIGILLVVGALMLGGIFIVRPYALERAMTFLHPSSDPLASGYQLRQSLIAIGSGELFGRGFGKSIQKFNYLPEPASDSIFAVASEEFGFVGSVILIFLFVSFSARGLYIASRTPDHFGAILAVGISTYIIAEAYINIASMVGVIPLTGVPLVFISHGGTALMSALGATGILFSISRRAKTKQ